MNLKQIDDEIERLKKQRDDFNAQTKASIKTLQNLKKKLN